MTLFSLKDEGDTSPSESINQLLDKQANGFTIESMVTELGIGYLEATTQWLEENSIPEGNFNRYIPPAIIEKIMSEALEENMLRPSFSQTHKTNSLDFLL